MLTPMTDEEMSLSLDSFWPAALDLRRSGYPTYTDGVKTRADWEKHISCAARDAWGEVLLYRHDEAPAGLATVELVDDEYLSLPVCVCLDYQQEMLEELLEYLTARYPGRTLWLGFAPENTQRLAFARDHHFELLDDLVNWNAQGWPSGPMPEGVRSITEESYEDFRCLWTDEAIYWNAERIRDALDKWLLFVTDSAAVACMDVGVMLEVFGFAYREDADPLQMRGLLEACLNAAGKRPLTYFASREESDMMEELGFRRISGYVCYQKTL